MANETLEAIARDVGTINVRIKEAQELLEAMREAGEPTTTLEADIRSLIIRKDKWEKMLKSRGYNVAQG